MANNIIRKPTAFFDTFDRKPGTEQQVFHYCPGCGHGRIHKLIAEAMEDLGITEKTVFVSPVGCSVFGYYYFNCGNIQSAHGRAPAIATAASRSNPGSVVISYQGDGDLAAIGTAEIIHAANRGEKIAVFFVNNQIYGMTGGQMAPTTLEGQKTATSPMGRDISEVGAPIRVSEIISTLDAPVYVERVAVSDSKNIMKAKRAIQKALKIQKEGKGFTFVEILSACPIGWKMKPVDAVKRINEVVEKYFPVKTFKDESETRTAKPVPSGIVKAEDVINVLGVRENKAILTPREDLIKNFKTQKIRISGFGGQGVLLAGTTMGYLAMELDLKSTWIPSYGPEMRGGTANCHVVLSNKQIGSPVVEDPNVLIAMNTPSLDQFEKQVQKDGLVIVNSSIVDRKVARTDVRALYIPMTEIAEKAGVRQASNMVAVAAYLEYTKIIPIEDLIKLVRGNFKKKELAEANINVINKACEYVRENCK